MEQKVRAIPCRLKGDPAEKQVSTLLYCLGEEAENVLSSTNITEDERKAYDSVIAKFNAFFKVRKNVIFERARFNRRDQQKGEPAEQYILELYKLAESCEYREMRAEMIRDRLVVGIRDWNASNLMQHLRWTRPKRWYVSAKLYTSRAES